jgi:ParB family transcriptional regulator, chromosome partitioning protein
MLTKKSRATKSTSFTISPRAQIDRGQLEAAVSQNVAIDRIRFPLKQPRCYFNAEKQAQLVASVRQYGVLEPLLVRPLHDGEFELVAGERRLRAAKEAGLTEVPVISRELDNKEALQVSLIENLQREDLNPVEETESILNLLAIELDVTADEVVSILNQAHNAKKRKQSLTHNVMGQLDRIEQVLTGIGRFTADSFRANRLPLLSLPADILTALRQGQLEYTKAQAIARVKQDEKRQALLHEVIKLNLPLSEIRARVKALNQEQDTTKQEQDTTKADQRLGDKFSKHTADVINRLKRAEIWKDAKKRKQAEKLLAELAKLAEP